MMQYVGDTTDVADTTGVGDITFTFTASTTSDDMKTMQKMLEERINAHEALMAAAGTADHHRRRLQQQQQHATARQKRVQVTNGSFHKFRIITMIILPRQAQDKHEEYSTKH